METRYEEKLNKLLGPLVHDSARKTNYTQLYWHWASEKQTELHKYENRRITYTAKESQRVRSVSNRVVSRTTTQKERTRILDQESAPSTTGTAELF